MELNDTVLDHLRHVTGIPDFPGARYVIDSEIGRGGMGVVYAARDTTLDRVVALKVIDSPISGEAELIARLEHPAIVPIYDAGVLADGRAFYAMKRIDGSRLDLHMAGKLTLPEFLRVIRRVTEALAFAHSRGVLHRDLKPQNIMVGEFGEVYVLDWGVAAIAGTAAFRAPETQMDERSDLYSLGKLMLLLLPEQSSSALQAIAFKAANADPAARYPGATALLDDLSRFENGYAVGAWSEPLWHRLHRFASRNALLLGLLAAYAATKFLLFFLRTA